MLLLAWLLLPHASAAEHGPWLDAEPEAPAPPVLTPLPACDEPALPDGVLLPELPGLLVRWDPRRSWGTPALVDTLVTAAERVEAAAPWLDPVLVGDMSRQYGGPLGGHREHRSGRDADVGLYMTGGVQPLDGFVDVPPSRLDAAATWLLVQSLVETGNVEWILLDPALIQRLRGHVLDHRLLPRDLLDEILPARDGDTSALVRGARAHRNHLHVRVRCEPGDTG